jgi:hypothetical protein
MLTERERTQLVSDYQREPVSVAGMLLTCAVGILMVIVLALVGMDIHNYDHQRMPAQTAAESR